MGKKKGGGESGKKGKSLTFFFLSVLKVFTLHQVSWYKLVWLFWFSVITLDFAVDYSLKELSKVNVFVPVAEAGTRFSLGNALAFESWSKC